MSVRRLFEVSRAVLIPALLGLAIICCVMTVFVVLTTPEGLDPIDGITLRVYLATNRDELNRPKGTDPTLKRFTVEEGESANDVGVKLVTEGFINNGTLFARFAQFEGRDDEIRPGVYFLAESMSIPQILDELTDPIPNQIRITVRENLRREEIAALIDATEFLEFTGAEFLAATDPEVVLANGFRERYGIPIDQSLEGFLFPDTYLLDITTTAIDFRDLMLQTFTNSVTPDMEQTVTASPMTMYEVVTLASIVEREAVLPEERPTIADVYLNRLEVAQKLDADPTVQYQLANNRLDGEWWPRITFNDYTGVEGPYNTYIHTGLPPGPIVSPSISSIRAVIFPADTPYFYFQASCEGDGSHQFSVTFDEHLSKGC
ncbi:MAG: endolytic transglycosylase MltG [Chloroflexi bacterium]|nr:endolytic transglycosylase MltG [Chloroflexota bacterium]